MRGKLIGTSVKCIKSIITILGESFSIPCAWNWNILHLWAGAVFGYNLHHFLPHNYSKSTSPQKALHLPLQKSNILAKKCFAQKLATFIRQKTGVHQLMNSPPKSLPSSKNIGSVWSSSNRRHLFCCLCRWFLKTMFPICHFCKQKASKICTSVQGTFKLLLRLVSPGCIIGALRRPYYSRVSQPNCMFNDLNWQHDKDLADGPGHLAVILAQKGAHITLPKHLCHYP